MALYVTQGTVYEIGDLKEGVTNEREWKLRSFVIEETREFNGKKYSDFTEFTAFGQGADGLSDVNVGDKVEVNFSIQSKKRTSQAGNEYWGTSLRAVSFKTVEDGLFDQPKEPATADLEPKEDDLPF